MRILLSRWIHFLLNSFTPVKDATGSGSWTSPKCSTGDGMFLNQSGNSLLRAGYKRITGINQKILGWR